MSADSVVTLMRDLENRSLRVWIAGGWAVDALVGSQTRPHDDLDLAVDDRDLNPLLDLLSRQGFSVTTDWAPARLELSDEGGRVLDLHPVRFRDDGSGTQSGLGSESFYYAPDAFASGLVDGETVPCLSAAQQLAFRVGYPPRPVDVHDIALLRRLL